MAGFAMQDIFGVHVPPTPLDSSFAMMRNICHTPLQILHYAEDKHPEIFAMFILRLVSSSLSIVATGSIIFASLVSGQLTNSDVHPIFMLSVADFFVAAMWLTGAAVAMQAPSFIGFCYFMGIITTCAVLVSFLLTATYANIAFLTVRELYKNGGIQLPLQDKRKRPRYILTVIMYIASWVVPFAVVLPLMVGREYYELSVPKCCSYCVADFAGLRAQFKNCTDGLNGKEISYRFDSILAYAFVTCFFLTSAAMLVCYCCLLVYARKVTKIYNSEIVFDDKDKNSVVEVLVRITLFVVIFFLSAIPTLAASALIWKEKEAIEDYEWPDRAILLVQAIFAPLQGLLNSIVYGWSRRRFLRLFCSRTSCFCFCCRRRKRLNSSQVIQDYGSLYTSSEHESFTSSPSI